MSENRSGEQFRSYLVGPISRWWIVVGGAMVNMFAAGLFAVYVVGVLFTQASHELGWPSSTTSLLLTSFFFSSGIGLLLTGYLIGQYGTRKPTIPMVVLYGLSVASLTIAPPSEALFIFIFFLIGLFGAPVSAMPFSIAIFGFFDRYRGLAFGLVAAGAGAGSATLPRMSNFLLEEIGWRGSILTFAAVSVSMALLSMTFLLRTPEGAVARKNVAHQLTEAPYSYRDLVDRVLVIIVVILILNASCTIGVVGGMVPMLAEKGISTAVAASMLSTAGLASWIGRIIVGWLLDRFFAPHVATAAFVLGALGTILIYYNGGEPLGFLGAMLVGTALGAEGDLAMYLVSRYFPLAAYSRAVSIAWLAWAWGGGVGSFLFAQSYSLTTSYGAALWIIVGLFGVAAILALTMPPYRYKPHDQP